jgi:hypothetical protein
MKRFAIIAVAGLAVAACRPAAEGADSAVRRQQGQAMQSLQATVGQPRIVNWTEARLMNRIYELRDQPNLATFTYRSDLNGQLHCVGRSIGYGLPYAAQRSNPERVLQYDEYSGSGPGGTIPQAEPNGLFMPDSAAATWVLLIDGEGNAQPVYIEDEITVSPFPLQNVATQCR